MRPISRPRFGIRQCSAAFEILSSLPAVRKVNQIARLLKVREQFANNFLPPGQNQIRPNVGQRFQDKLPQVDPRMRQLQSSIVDLSTAAIEQVNINGSRNVLWMIPFAAQCFFDPNELLE